MALVLVVAIVATRWCLEARRARSKKVSPTEVEEIIVGPSPSKTKAPEHYPPQLFVGDTHHANSNNNNNSNSKSSTPDSQIKPGSKSSTDTGSGRSNDSSDSGGSSKHSNSNNNNSESDGDALSVSTTASGGSTSSKGAYKDKLSVAHPPPHQPKGREPKPRPQAPHQESKKQKYPPREQAKPRPLGTAGRERGPPENWEARPSMSVTNSHNAAASRLRQLGSRSPNPEDLFERRPATATGCPMVISSSEFNNFPDAPARPATAEGSNNNNNNNNNNNSNNNNNNNSKRSQPGGSNAASQQRQSSKDREAGQASEGRGLLSFPRFGIKSRPPSGASGQDGCGGPGGPATPSTAASGVSAGAPFYEKWGFHFADGSKLRPPPTGTIPNSSSNSRPTSSSSWLPWRRSLHLGFGSAAPTAEDSAAVATQKLHDSAAAMMERIESTRSEPLHVRKNIFRDLQRQLHPDKNMHCSEAATQAFQQLMDLRQGYLRP